MRIRDGRGFKEARAGDGVKLIFPTGTESCGRVQHCIAPALMAGPVVGVVVAELIPGRERERGQLIQVATLDKTSYPRIEMCRRVYSPDGIAPTIHTCGGGGQEPKILVVGQPPGYEKNGRIYGPDGIAPTIQGRDYKDPAKIAVGGVSE